MKRTCTSIDGTLHIAHFYQPRSLPVDGWHNRLTVACHDFGGIINPKWYDYIVSCRGFDHWTHLGTHPVNAIPSDIWRPARVTT